MIDDVELLRRFAEERDQSAFATLVDRHLALVYAAALRQLAGAPHRAEEVAQSVFIDLARKAARLTRHPHLVGWLYQSTRFASAKLKRSEQRRQHREQEAHAMHEANANDEGAMWERLRPVLDEALLALSEPDRTVILWRFFEGRRFGEIGPHLGISDDAARMRVERALERLRQVLARREITSTSTALALLLAHAPAVAVPAGLASTISHAALAVTPLPAGVASFFVMSKLTPPLVAGVAATALTLGLWTLLPDTVTARELEALRAENARLQTAAATASEISPPDAPAAAAARTLARQLEQRRLHRTVDTSAAARAADETATSPVAHRNHGIATPLDALRTFAWASDAADVEALAAMTWFDPEVREKALATMAELPPAVTAQYPTPERFYGFIIAALCLQAPPPGADVVERMLAQATAEEIRPGRLVYPNRYELQQTPEGWKWVFPEVGVTTWLHVLGDNVLTESARP